jgi:hypothetical protein
VENPLVGEQSAALLSLAKSREPADRERLLMNIVSLCELAGTGGGAEAIILPEKPLSTKEVASRIRRGQNFSDQFLPKGYIPSEAHRPRNFADQ